MIMVFKYNGKCNETENTTVNLKQIMSTSFNVLRGEYLQ